MWLHLCRGPACCPADAQTSVGGGTAAAGRAARRPLTIDLHCHVLCLAAEGLVKDRPQKAAEPERMLAAMGPASIAHNNAVMLPQAFPKLTRVEQRLADMDAMGVDVQVLSPSPNQYYDWADADLAQALATTINTHVAELCAAHPTRLAGLGLVSLQHPALAVEQLRHAVRTLGLRGVEISTAVAGKELSDPALRPFWAEAEALGVLVFIHPFGTTLGARLANHYLSNTIGQPLETTIALSHLVFGGVLDAHPGLKILAAHGGGYLPTYPGRSDHAHAVRPEAAADSAMRPSDALRRIWVDSVVYDPMAMRHLIDRVGVSQVVVGTDYPYDMGHTDVHGLVQATPGLSDDERMRILGGNAAALIGWPAGAEGHRNEEPAAMQ